MLGRRPAANQQMPPAFLPSTPAEGSGGVLGGVSIGDGHFPSYLSDAGNMLGTDWAEAGVHSICRRDAQEGNALLNLQQETGWRQPVEHNQQPWMRQQHPLSKKRHQNLPQPHPSQQQEKQNLLRQQQQQQQQQSTLRQHQPQQNPLQQQQEKRKQKQRPSQAGRGDVQLSQRRTSVS